ncbi:hypothetical protein [Lentzea sp. NPDC051838]|uniref:hypothetical protein n=1 Tax=Lentzea sp. NPDC051838 TaxID=3154849 RepID=UPI0034442E8A
MTLPCTHGFTSGKTVQLPDRSGSTFDLALRFPADETLREERTDGDRVVIGYIYLDISDTHPVLPDHWRFGFTPATSTQSKLFLRSPSIRETFAQLALSTGASLCLLGNGLGAPEIIVTALGQRVSTSVPGPCLLWRPRGHNAEAFEELSARLAGRTPATPRWIIGPEHPEFADDIDSLADYARVLSPLWAAC